MGGDSRLAGFFRIRRVRNDGRQAETKGGIVHNTLGPLVVNKKMKMRAYRAAAPLLALLAAASSANGSIFSYSGSIETYVVPTTGTYDISVSGAQGGAGVMGNTGGLGALVSGDVFLTTGTTLDIVVGQQGANGVSQAAGGGGGGSFVYIVGASNPLAVAGGGGGGGVNFSSSGVSGTNATSGRPGFDPNNTDGGFGGSGGSGGGGGTGNQGNGNGLNGGGGGGWLGNGGAGALAASGSGGHGAFLFSGGAGGSLSGNVAGNGGFGSGGGGGVNGGGGGGGGYSGGGGGGGNFGGGGGGGGSYLDSSIHQYARRRPASMRGNGQVSITDIPSGGGVPEPASIAVWGGLGVAALGGYRWRRRDR